MKTSSFLFICSSLFFSNICFAQIYVSPGNTTYQYGNNTFIYPQYPVNNLLYAQNQCRQSNNFNDCMSRFGFSQIPNSNTFTHSNNNTPNIVIPNKNTPDYLLKNACTPSNLSTCGNGNNQIIIRQ